jgi:hypothetical protein
VERLKKVFAELGEKPTDQHCNGMEGVVINGKEAPKRTKKYASQPKSYSFELWNDSITSRLVLRNV